MKISDFIMISVFSLFVLTVSVGLAYAIGREAIGRRVISLEEDVTPAQKLTALDVAKQAAKTYNPYLFSDASWHRLELIHHEWNSQHSALEIRYFAHDKEPTRFFVIVRPRETLGGIAIGIPKESRILGLAAPTDNIPESRDFVPGAKIVSGFGVIHTLSKASGGSLTISPPITQAEIERNFLLIEDPQATVDMFEIEGSKKE